jgi:hypothetical protein
VIALTIAGCGSKTANLPVTGATHAVGEGTGPAGGTTGASGGTMASSADQFNPNDPGEGDEEAASTPVDVGLDNGKFTQSTTKTVHVAPFIAVAIKFTVKDDQTYAVTIVKGKEQFPQMLHEGTKTVKIDGLRAGKKLQIVLGDNVDHVTVSADADPGP